MTKDLDEYRALLQKVAAAGSAIEARRQADLRCGRGCHQCCLVHLELLPVEAAAVRDHLRSMDAEGRAQIAERARAPGEACVMLASDGSCDIYEARPLVCRTQGHALAYPPDVIPVDAVRARAGGDVTWCPLNYPDAPPDGADVLNVEVLDRLLFIVNQRFAEPRGLSSENRESLTAIAAEG